MNQIDLPIQFQEKLIILFGEEKAKTLLQTFCFAKPITIRINTLNASKEQVLQFFDKQNIQYSSVPWFDLAFIIHNATTRELTDLEIYKQGFFYIQNLSSMIPALVLDPQKDEKVLDLAAAPGSKTTQMAAMMNNEGEIIANDVSRTRMFKLQDNLSQQGVSNTKVITGPGERVWQKYPEYFDKVLVDVPCSMEGRFVCGDIFSYKDWSLKKVKILAKQQQWLLRSAISATKVGGLIVYSTCTISPEENEGVIDWLIKKEKANVEIEEIFIKDLEKNEAISSFGEKKYNPEVVKTLRILPSQKMEGFYVAKIRKIGSNVRNYF